MAKKLPEESNPHKVGDHIKAKLNDGRVGDATVRAVSQQDGEAAPPAVLVE